MRSYGKKGDVLALPLQEGRSLCPGTPCTSRRDLSSLRPELRGSFSLSRDPRSRLCGRVVTAEPCGVSALPFLHDFLFLWS